MQYYILQHISNECFIRCTCINEDVGQVSSPRLITISSIYCFIDTSSSKQVTGIRPKHDITQPAVTSKNPATAPGLSVMPGPGQSLGGSTPRPEGSGGINSSVSGARQSTPDPEEVRRRRLAFLEKQNPKK